MAAEISFQETEEILESIINNQRLVKIDSKDGVKFLIFSHPAADEILCSRHRRELALIEAEKEGLPSLAEVNELIEQKIVGQVDGERIEELEDKISAQKKVLQLTKIPGRRMPIEEAIENYSNEIEQLKAKGEAYQYHSREKKADEEALLYLAWAATRTIEGPTYWGSFQDFEDETDLILRNSVLETFGKFNKGLPIKTIRYMSRHGLWRVRYVAALKIGGSLFDLEDLTPDQLGLLYWSNYYQSIYEMMPDDQPDDETIQDDEALDKYMEDYFKRREKERNEGKVNRRNTSRKGKGKLAAWDRSDELIITPSHPEYMKMEYSEERIKSEETSEVEVVAPNSKRARNRRAMARNRQGR